MTSILKTAKCESDELMLLLTHCLPPNLSNLWHTAQDVFDMLRTGGITSYTNKKRVGILLRNQKRMILESNRFNKLSWYCFQEERDFDNPREQRDAFRVGGRPQIEENYFVNLDVTLKYIKTNAAQTTAATITTAAAAATTAAAVASNTALATISVNANKRDKGVGQSKRNAKKPRIMQEANANKASGTTTANDLTAGIKATIFGYFGPIDIMNLRCVCKSWKEAAKKTIVPITSCNVSNSNHYKTLEVMTTALPNLQRLAILYLYDDENTWNKFYDGEDACEFEARATSHWHNHDIEIVSRFRNLRELNLFQTSLNGRYPILFNFPLVQKLSIGLCDHLKWDLSMLAGFPLLKELEAECNPPLTGNINSLQCLKDTLERVNIKQCPLVEGNFMDLADFPQLRELRLDTVARGDLRDVDDHDFPKLECLDLPSNVVGAEGYEFERIRDVPEVMQAIHYLRYRGLCREWDQWQLSEDSPDWHGFLMNENLSQSQPLWMLSQPSYIELVEAGSRLGWRWYGKSFTSDHVESILPCETNWLDPAPEEDSCDYETYVEDLCMLEEGIFYRGFYQPPTYEELIQIFVQQNCLCCDCSCCEQNSGSESE